MRKNYIRGVPEEAHGGFSRQPFAARKYLQAHNIFIQRHHLGLAGFPVHIFDYGQVSECCAFRFYADGIAYNFQYAMKDPGAFAHNPKYVLQILYDSLADLGGDVEGRIRP